MIFIAGVQPKTTVIDRTPRRCPACGLVRARRQRVDHYFSLFFIPVIRVKKGEAVLFCDRCNQPVAESSAGTRGQDLPDCCSACGGRLEKNHRFCPYCGQPR